MRGQVEACDWDAVTAAVDRDGYAVTPTALLTGAQCMRERDRFSDDSGKITAEGMEHLKTVMPQIDEGLVGTLEAEHVISHFTVQNLGDMVAQRAAAGAGA